MKRVAVAALLLALAVPACGGDEPEPIAERVEKLLPRDRALASTPAFPHEYFAVRLRLSRADAAVPSQARTRIHYDRGDDALDLPAGKVGPSASRARLEEYAAAFAKLDGILRQRVKMHGGDASEVRGKVELMQGHAVPPTDVLRVVGAFLVVGVRDVVLLDGTETREPTTAEVLVDLSRDGVLEIGDRTIKSVAAADLRKALESLHSKQGLPWPPRPRTAPWLHLRTEWGMRARVALPVFELLREPPLASYRLRISVRPKDN